MAFGLSGFVLLIKVKQNMNVIIHLCVFISL